MNIPGLEIRQPCRSEEILRLRHESVGLTDNDTRIFFQFRIVETTGKQLCRAAQATEWISNFMRKLPDNALTRAALGNERLFLVELPPLRCIEELDDYMI